MESKLLLLLLIISLASYGCVEAQLASPNIRTVNKVVGIDTSNAKNLFEHARVWFARDHSETKLAVSYVDMDHLQILAKADMYCNSSIGSGLRGMGLGVNVSRLTFNIELVVRNGEVNITYDEIYYYLQDMRYQATKLVQGPSDNDQVNTLYGECIQPLHQDLLAHLNT
jgi:hypothetical protein